MPTPRTTEGALGPAAWSAAAAALLLASCSGGGSHPDPAAIVTVEIGGPTGDTIRALTGVNAGPLAAPSLSAEPADLTGAYRRAGVSTVRTNDYFGPLDMSTMFPDLSADPLDPASYDFARSDSYYAAIVSGGFEPYLRLGDSWGPTPSFEPPEQRSPEDPAAWALAARHVVRRYADRERWGLDRPVCVEVWNEPNSPVFWDGSVEEFCRLYAMTSVLVRNDMPELPVGGPGFAPRVFREPGGGGYPRKLLAYAAIEGLPVDFLSWHLYSNDPSDFAAAQAYYEALTDSLGLDIADYHNTEWSTMAPVEDPFYEQLRLGARGSSMLTAVWMTFQDMPMREAFLYRGDEPGDSVPVALGYGILSPEGELRASGHAMSMWETTAGHPARLSIELSGDADGRIHAIAGASEEGSVALLLGSLSDRDRMISIEGGDWSAARAVVLFGEPAELCTLELETAGAETGLELPARSCALVLLDSVEDTGTGPGG